MFRAQIFHAVWHQPRIRPNVQSLSLYDKAFIIKAS